MNTEAEYFIGFIISLESKREINTIHHKNIGKLCDRLTEHEGMICLNVNL